MVVGASRATLLLLRHAKAEDYRSGSGDFDRVLSPRGRDQARRVGELLSALEQPVDEVLCSPSARTRETLALSDVTAHTTFPDSLYNASTEEVFAAIRQIPADARCVLVVGHAPSIPDAAAELSDQKRSERSALITLSQRFPPAALAVLAVQLPWAHLSTATLERVDLSR